MAPTKTDQELLMDYPFPTFLSLLHLVFYFKCSLTQSTYEFEHLPTMLDNLNVKCKCPCTTSVYSPQVTKVIQKFQV